MIVAAFKGDAQVVAAWLDEGGGVDARCAEHGGVTLLMAAADGRQEAMVRMLLQRSASVNLQGHTGGTALMNAAGNGQTTTVQALLDAKADTSLQDSDGYSALSLAEEHKHTATAQMLRLQAAAHAPTPSLSGSHVRIFAASNPSPSTQS